MKKTIFTLNINNYCPEITAITYPLLKYYADKIGAQFHVITERKFPQWPITYEKLQIFQLGREMGNEWNIYIDSDALIHPASPDWTIFLNKDTVAHWGADMACVRWKYDEYFLRHGQHWGTGNWFTIGSNWCLDMWRPLEVSPAAAFDNIFPTHEEMNAGITKEHLIDDYALSHNIARFGLKTDKIADIRDRHDYIKGKAFCIHWYMTSDEIKISKLKDHVKAWHVPEYVQNFEK